MRVLWILTDQRSNMKVKLYNATDDLIVLDVDNVALLPNEYNEVETNNNPVHTSNSLISLIANGDVIINNYTMDMSATAGIRWLVTQADALPLNKDGKIAVHATSKAPGLYVYWTGRGDNYTNGYIGNGETIILSHKVGEDKSQHKYIDFMCLDNKTQMHEGTIIWSGAKMGDSGSCSMVTSVMPVEPGENTNFNLYGGYLIVPAAGDGTINVTGDMTNIDPALGCFVEMMPDETGEMTPAFWNADYNPSTLKFENITPAPAGDGKYNMFAVEITISRFVNHLNLIGEGVVTLNSDDSDEMTHGMRLLHHINTSELDGIEDHDWHFSVCLTLQRDRTY